MHRKIIWLRNDFKFVEQSFKLNRFNALCDEEVIEIVILKKKVARLSSRLNQGMCASNELLFVNGFSKIMSAKGKVLSSTE